jgi:anti-anti-sigma regulatory factor
MAFEMHYDPDAKCLVFSGPFNIYNINEIRAELIVRPDTQLDLTEVEDIDGAGLQALLAHCRDNRQQLHRLSDTVQDTLTLTGLSQLTGGEA